MENSLHRKAGFASQITVIASETKQSEDRTNQADDNVKRVSGKQISPGIIILGIY